MKLLLNLLWNKLYSDFLTCLIRNCINQITKHSRDSFPILFKGFLMPSVMLHLISPAPSLQCFAVFVSQLEKVLAS